MKTIHTVTEPIQFPQFWDEKWLRIAIEEIDRRSMTPEELYQYEKTLAQNAQVVWDEKRKMEKVERDVKTNATKKALLAGKLSKEEIAEYLDVPIDFVLTIQKELAKPNGQI